MDRVFSTRLDEKLIHKIDAYVAKKSITKKRLVEEALNRYFEEAGTKLENEILERAFGSWQRDESADATFKKVREQFNKGFERHKGRGDSVA